MNEIFEATFVGSNIVRTPSGEEYATRKSGKIGEKVFVRLHGPVGMPYASVLEQPTQKITTSENRSKSLTVVKTTTLDNTIINMGNTYGVEYDNCVIVETPDGIITDYTFKDYTNTTLITDYIAGSSAVYLNGLRLLFGTDYTELHATGKIVFTTLPQTGDSVIIKVRRAVTFTP